MPATTDSTSTFNPGPSSARVSAPRIVWTHITVADDATVRTETLDPADVVRDPGPLGEVARAMMAGFTARGFAHV